MERLQEQEWIRYRNVDGWELAKYKVVRDTRWEPIGRNGQIWALQQARAPKSDMALCRPVGLAMSLGDDCGYDLFAHNIRHWNTQFVDTGRRICSNTT